MTEQEWLESSDPTPMLEFLQSKPSARKLRLFAVACCRRIWPLLHHEAFRRAVELSERFAEGQRSKKDLEAAAQAAWTVARQTILQWCGPNHPEYLDFAVGQMEDAVTLSHPAVATANAVTFPKRMHQIRWAAYHTACLVEGEADSQIAAKEAAAKEKAAQARLLRDVIGNPFHPLSLEPTSRTPAVTQLAAAAYEERILPSGELDLARLTVLADALEEAGCTDQALLDHLRGPGPHIRGCFVVDLCLAKK